MATIATQLAAAVNGKGDPSQLPVGVMSNSNANYWTVVGTGVARAQAETGVPATYWELPTGGGPSDQDAEASTLLKTVKGLAISVAGANDATMLASINAAVAAGTPVITIDSDMPTSARKFFVATDNVAAGTQLGTALGQAMGGKGTAIILGGYSTAGNASDRDTGVKAGLLSQNIKVCNFDLTTVCAASTTETQQQPDQSPCGAFYTTGTTQVASPYPASFTPQNSTTDSDTQLAAAFALCPEATGIASVYGYEVGAIENYIKYKSAKGVILAGVYDTSSDDLADVQNGIIQAVVGQRPYWMGYLGVYINVAINVIGYDATLAILQKNQPLGSNNFLDSGFDLVTPDNLADYQSYLSSVGIVL